MFGVMHGVASAMSNYPLTFAPIAPVTEFSIVHAVFITRLLMKPYVSPVVIFTNVAPHPTHKYDLIGKIKGKDVIFIGSNNGIYEWVRNDFDIEYLVQVKITKPYVVNGEIAYLPGENPHNDYESRYSKETEHYTFGAHTILGSIAVALR